MTPITSRHRGIMVYAIGTIFVIVVVAAVGGPQISRILHLPDYTESAFGRFIPPNSENFLGTDYLGRDVASRLLNGGRSLLLIAAVATALTEFVSLLFVVIRYRRRTAATVLSLLTDCIILVPPIIVLLAASTVASGSTLIMSVLTAIVAVPGSTRYLTAALSPVFNSGYVEASILQGDSDRSVFFREILPNSLSPIFSNMGIRFVSSLFLVSTAQYLGASTSGISGDWASAIQSNFVGLDRNPWAAGAPALALTVLAISANLLADRFSGGER